MVFHKPKAYITNHKGLGKIHKKDTRIRHIINWKNAPAYKLAKILAEKLQTNILLPYIFNVRNTAHLINDLNEIP